MLFLVLYLLLLSNTKYQFIQNGKYFFLGGEIGVSGTGVSIKVTFLFDDQGNLLWTTGDGGWTGVVMVLSIGLFVTGHEDLPSGVREF